MDTVVRPGDTLLDKYRVERVLGQGGMGVVVAARHVELGQLFAIKCLLPSALADDDAVQRFLREARAAAGIASEHVVKVMDVGRLETGAPYMVMEHLTGSDLGQILEARGALPVGEAVAYVLQACEAISEAHGMGIVHRDIKPANLFVVKWPNGSWSLKILDFGISKQVVPDEVRLTKTGAVMGSPLYMSPEQMVSSKRVDARTDVWAMGVVLYELCTGKPPFDGETVTEVVARVVQDEPVPPSKVRPSIPAGLDAIVGRCLQKMPERRFASIAELADAIRPFAVAPRAMAASTQDIGEEDTVVAAMQVFGHPTAGLQGAVEPQGSSAPWRRAVMIAGGVAVVLALVVSGVWLSGRSSAVSGAAHAPRTTGDPSAQARAEPTNAPAPASSSAAEPVVEPSPIGHDAGDPQTPGPAGSTAAAGATAPSKAAPPPPEKSARPAPPPKAAPAAPTPARTSSAPAPKREPLF